MKKTIVWYPIQEEQVVVIEKAIATQEKQKPKKRFNFAKLATTSFGATFTGNPLVDVAVVGGVILTMAGLCGQDNNLSDEERMIKKLAERIVEEQQRDSCGFIK